MKVIKRDGQKVDFDASKIENAILKAMKCGSGIVDTKCAHDIAVEIEAAYRPIFPIKKTLIAALIIAPATDEYPTCLVLLSAI